MIIYKIKKMWGGDVSVGSFVVKYALKTKQKIRLEYDSGHMIIDGNTPYKITAPTQIAQRTDQYIKKGEPYQLYDYKWEPRVVEPDGYTEEGMIKLHEVMLKVFGKKTEQLKI